MSILKLLQIYAIIKIVYLIGKSKTSGNLKLAVQKGKIKVSEKQKRGIADDGIF